MKALIVDDESPARTKLRNFLAEDGRCRVIGEAQNGFQAVELIENRQPDLVFLDIQMPGMTGFDVIETIGVERFPTLIFTTAFDEHAVKAFDVSALDYLLKPYSFERLQTAIDRAQGKSSTNLAEFLEDRGPLTRLLVKKGARLVMVRFEQVSHIEAEEKYVRIHLSGEDYLHRMSLTHLEHRLDPQQFVRIHRKTIVNINAVIELTPISHGDYWLKLINGTEVVMSRTFKPKAMPRLGSY